MKNETNEQETEEGGTSELTRLLYGWWHRLMHLIGHNKGNVTTWWEGNSLMIGFECDYCGKVEGVYKRREK